MNFLQSVRGALSKRLVGKDARFDAPVGVQGFVTTPHAYPDCVYQITRCAGSEATHCVVWMWLVVRLFTIICFSATKPFVTKPAAQMPAPHIMRTMADALDDIVSEFSMSATYHILHPESNTSAISVRIPCPPERDAEDAAVSLVQEVLFKCAAMRMLETLDAIKLELYKTQ